MCLISKPASFMHWIAVARKVCCAIHIFGYICHECELILFNRNVRVPDRFIFMFVEGRLCASTSIEETCRVRMCFRSEILRDTYTLHFSFGFSDASMPPCQYGCFESFLFHQNFVIFVRQITWFRWTNRHWTSGVNVHNKNSNRFVTF